MAEQVVWSQRGSVSLLSVRNCEAPTSSRIASGTSLQRHRHSRASPNGDSSKPT